MTPDESFRVALTGLFRGADLSGAATLVLRHGTLELATGRGVVIVREEWVLGVSPLPGGADLFLAGGDVVRIEGERAVGAALEARIFALPELAHSLRALGSARTGGGAEQGRFFAPLLDARRRAARM
jgi:hypothetical protein